MHAIKRGLFYLSLGINWSAHAARYWLTRMFGAQGEVTGVRVILIRNGRVVLVKHWWSPGVWTLPGGGIKEGETAEEAARREIKEEIGYGIHSFGGCIGVYTGPMGPHDSVTVLFSEDFEGSMRFVPNIEIMERSLFGLGELPKHISPANRRRVEAYARGVRDERGVW